MMSERDKIFWVLWLVAMGLLVWAVMPSFGEMPPEPKVESRKPKVEMTQGAGAMLLKAESRKQRGKSRKQKAEAMDIEGYTWEQA